MEPLAHDVKPVSVDSKEMDAKTYVRETDLSDESVHEPHVAKNFKWYELIATCFCMNNVPAIMCLLLSTNYIHGGIPSLFYGILIAYSGAMMTGFNLAELSSVVPTVGGVYHFSIYLAPPKWKATFGWVVGILNFFGWMFNGASTIVLAAQAVIAFVQIYVDGYSPARWVYYLISVGLFAPLLWINIYGVKWIGKLDMVIVTVQIFGILAFIIAMFAMTHPLASAYTVFAEVTYDAPTTSTGNALMLGFLSACTLATGLDAAAHLAPEVKNPRKMVPQILMMVLYIGATTGFVFSLLVGFLSVDISIILESVNGIPWLTLVAQTLKTKAGAVIFNIIITAVAMNGVLGSVLVGSRQMMSLAQDGVFPASWRLHEVDPVKKLPVRALVILVAFEILFNLMYLSGSAGWNALNTACVFSFNASYIVVIAQGMWRGRQNLPADRQFKLPVLLGRFTDSYAFLYQLFSLVVFCYPGSLPLTQSSFNYGVACEIALIALCLISWVVYGRTRYEAVDVVHLIAIQDRRDEETAAEEESKYVI